MRHLVNTSAKIAISINRKALKRLDYYVKRKVFKNRSQAIQWAVILELDRLEHTRLAEECAKLDVNEERAMAEEGLGEDLLEWPKY
jgi:metal-responsive CopG/Arc/MetJ family transcriptional regulator